MAPLREGPISDNYYHDCELFGIVSDNGDCLLMLRSPERDNRRHDVRLHGVELLYVKNFMQGNIIFDIRCSDITEENFRETLGTLLDRNSEYMNHFDSPQYQASYRARYIGKKLVSITSSYGASLVCVCTSALETSPA